MNESKQKNIILKRKLFSIESILIGICIIVFTIAVISFIGNFYIQKSESRVVLQQGKAVLLAMNVASAECYAQNTLFADNTGDYGFADGIRQEIQELSGCTGEIYLLSWDKKNRQVLKFCYVEGDYVATYELNKNQEIRWDVFRIQSKM